jgi:MFS family permease
VTSKEKPLEAHSVLQRERLKCHWRSVAHTYSYRRWRGIAAALAVLIGTLSAVAGSTLLATADAASAWRVVAGILGLLGAVMLAIDRGLGASTQADLHRQAAQRFRAIAAEYFAFAEAPPRDATEAQQKLDEIRRKHAEAEEASEPAEKWADDKATAGYEEMLQGRAET